MARAHTVWLVLTGEFQEYVETFWPVAAFTVKHECATWLERQSDDDLPRMRVMKLPDGAHGDAGNAILAAEFLENY